MGECWGEGKATFMILGNSCTRRCGGCNVATGQPLEVDWDEPQRVAEAINLMKVKHAVITSVDRDELKDGGSIEMERRPDSLLIMHDFTSIHFCAVDACHCVAHSVASLTRLSAQPRPSCAAAMLLRH